MTRRYIYMTMLASVATICLQTNYVMQLHRNYLEDYIAKIERRLSECIGRERVIRVNIRDGRHPDAVPTVKVKFLSEMSPEELAAIRKLPSNSDTIDVTEARLKGIGGTDGEIYEQLMQDILFRGGASVNMVALDSLLKDTEIGTFPHQLLRFESDSVAVDSVGMVSGHPNYVSKLIPLGTKGKQFIRMKADIPLSPFIKMYFLTLLLSALMMAIVLFCLLYQLIVIRREQEALLTHETNFYGTIHDLKSPLNSVIAIMGWLKTTLTDETHREVVAESQAGVKRLVAQIETLLLSTKQNRGSLMPCPTETDVVAIAQRLKAEMAYSFASKPHNVMIINKLPENLIVRTDASYFELILRNLLENALKYADDGIAVYMSFALHGKLLAVEVKDNGWGIRTKDLHKLFRPFYRGSQPDGRKTKGYGIGLSQVKRMLEVQGGSICVESQVGCGTKFTIEIPINVN